MGGCTGDQRCERAARGRKENLPEELLLVGKIEHPHKINTSHHRGPSFIYYFLKGWVLSNFMWEEAA